MPVARLTYSTGKHEQIAVAFYAAQLTTMLKAAGATVAAAVPESLGQQSAIPHGAHVMGGMRMGADPRTSVTDAHGVVRGLHNVLVADGSVFPTSGAHNPTLTMMATAMRNARSVLGKSAPGTATPQVEAGHLAETGASERVAFVGVAAVAAGLAAKRALD